MARNTELTMHSITIENALLAHDYLGKIASLEALSQSEAEYGIPKGMKLRDEIGRYWRIAQAYWNDFSSQSAQLETTQAQERWLLPLMREVLGFDAYGVSAREIDERLFPITHEALDGSVPMVLTGSMFELDKSDISFGDETRKRSPHALMQEYLNANDEALWGIVCNGLKLRILRDNPSLTRPAYIEIDLERIFSEELYSEFVLFWLLAHRSRFEGADECILEQWRNQSEEEGERALNELRDGVMNALLALGNGFLLHPANKELKTALREGELSVEAFYQELLRLIYRFLFLFTAEERALLFDPDTSEEAKTLYKKGYSLGKLRDLSLRHTIKDRFDDLWEGEKIVFEALSRGEELLGLPALGGLFDTKQCATLERARLGNYYLLGAIRHLAFFRKGGVLSRINYRDMDTEELGSVYESLLELIPEIDHSAVAPFNFMGHTAGSARKLSGSYYTPDVLVQELIASALVPVIEEKLKDADDPVKALLSIRVIDPASGSGHFLLAAARKIAEYLAPYLAGGQPTSKEYRHALREVIGHCIYGVDLNPLAVELCKTALWLEALEPGKPLGFLDSKIQCGNALVGLYDGSLLKEGIPNEAYKALSGDDRDVCRELAAENRQHAKELEIDLKYNVKEVWDFTALPEETVEQIQNKAEAWKALQKQMCSISLKEDLYTASFFTPKTKATKELVPTNRHLRLLAQGQRIDDALASHIRQIADKHRFFHWHLAFADVFAEGGGFDCVLGNPPWDMLQLNPAEFFASRDPDIANARHSSAREKMIEKLKDDHPSLYNEYIDAKDAVLRTQAFVHSAGRFPLTSFGRINLAPLFTELGSRLKGKYGRTGMVVPSGIATDSFTQAFFRHLVESKSLISLYDFENKEKLFAAVDSRMKFCLLTLGFSEQAELLFFATNTSHLKNEERRFRLTSEEFALINPNTRTCPVFRTKTDAELTKKLYRKAPVLIKEATEEQEEINPWKIDFMLMFMMNTASHLFRTYDELTAQDGQLDGNRFIVGDELYLPLYEAKMIHHYDHRWATYAQNGEDTRDMSAEEKQNPFTLPLPRYWVHEHEVLLRTADVPKEIKNALKNGDREALLEAVLMWLLGQFSLRDDKRATKVLDLLGQADGIIDERIEVAKTMAKSHPLEEHQVVALYQALKTDLKEACWGILREKAPKFLLGFRDITNSTNERTMLSTSIPFSGVGNNLPLFVFDPNMEEKQVALLQANLTSLSFDFVARQKVGGTHMNFYVIKQLPVLSPDQYTQADLDYILPRVLELGYTAYDMQPWAEALGYKDEPFGWDEERRLQLKCELDAYYAHLYDLTRDELRYILDPSDIMGEEFPSVTFPGLKRKEMEKYGEFRTQRLVLEAYDKLARK